MKLKFKIAKIIYESDEIPEKKKLEYFNEIKNLNDSQLVDWVKITSIAEQMGAMMKGAAALGAGGLAIGAAARIAAGQKAKVQQLLNTCMQNCKYQFKTTQNKQAFDQCMMICQQRENMLSQQLKSKAGINPGMAQA